LEKYALNVKIAFEKAVSWDETLSENNGTPVYTNRLLVADRGTLLPSVLLEPHTYEAGRKLQKAVNSKSSCIRCVNKMA
jgi:hypothetical protein